MDLQEINSALFRFWDERGFYLAEPYDVEKGAGTMNPATFFRSLGPEPWAVAYVEPSRRPADGRYGENPNRLYQHLQFQVIMKPSPEDIVDTYLGSLETIGLSSRLHDIRLVEDNWEAPTLGAWGLGWEVWCDGMEITQFTFFQQMAGFELTPVPVEITYGLERIASYVQNVRSVFDVRVKGELTYGDLFLPNERHQSVYAFEVADVGFLRDMFEGSEREARRALERGGWPAAYDYTLKASHLFNLLEARGAVSQSERPALIGRVRRLARASAEVYLKEREELGFPLLKGGDAR